MNMQDDAVTGDPPRKGAWAVTIAAIGVVYGDIGTSPLYTMKEAFGPVYGLRATDANVLGILSLVFWSLVLVVTVKYVFIVMRADNRGEGGIMALMAMAQRSLPLASETAYVMGILGIFGAALFFGDGVITPAISVLSAVEGLEVAAPSLSRYIVPVTIGVLIALFAVQRKGTESVGKVFGPVTVLWFISLAVWGLLGIVDTPRVLAAVSPLPALQFVLHHGGHSFFVLGAVVLAVTGAEALYADMGHFGRKPIQRAWLWFVFPALVLNYFGQGALLLGHPSAASNPFYRLVPSWALVPMIVLATAATVIASQAVISGAFSIARQGMQLGFLPRLAVVHTSESTIGQVYVPMINRLLLLVIIGLVLGFGSSSALASAYGVSVTGTMLITSVLLLVVARHRWHLSTPMLVVLGTLMLVIDALFLGANLVKFADGGWFPLALGIVVFTLMRTWRRGRTLLVEELRKESPPIEGVVADIAARKLPRVPGTAVFLTADNASVPHALLQNLRHNKVLHQRNVLLTIETVQAPRADEDERSTIRAAGDGFWRVTVRFGFMEDPNVPRVLEALVIDGVEMVPRDTTYFASRETLVARKRGGMPPWRDKLFLLLSRNTVSATEFFHIPGSRLVELGTQVEI
ncbi:MAG TPA: potassium transporter Kup [Pseudomonadota bacterium]|nr:potassium transporter Kup [Xanthomonadales bacterium]HQX24875.1 potassium transporter Kup [Pseudomonadota bacterium]HQY37148.1 potassium transporter Kup [Pseudomonadota bacterium]